jgi:hypothetical protein
MGLVGRSASSRPQTTRQPPPCYLPRICWVTFAPRRCVLSLPPKWKRFWPPCPDRVEVRCTSRCPLWSKADTCSAPTHVRFTPESGHVRCSWGCPLWANKRRTALQQNSSPSCQRRQVLQLRFGIHLMLDDHRQRESKRGALAKLRYNRRCDRNTPCGSLSDDPKWLRAESAKRR